MATFLGLRFQHNVDVTGLGTFLLSLATLGLLYFARDAVVEARKQIHQIRIFGERTHRPVVIPVLDHRRMDLGKLGSTERAPKVNDGSKLIVPVENIGPGPAIKLRATARQIDTSTHTHRAIGEEKASLLVVGMATLTFIPLEIDVEQWPANASFELAMRYEDVAKNHWETLGTWSGDERKWSEFDIKEANAPGARR